MPKNYGVERNILKNLKNRELTETELVKLVIEETESTSEDSALKLVKRYLARNVLAGKIDVVGYDLKIFNKKIEEMVSEGKIKEPNELPRKGMIFTAIDHDPFEILLLMDSIEKNNDQLALKKLKRIFKKKIKEMDEIKHRNWIDMELDVKHRDLNEEEVIILAVMKELQPERKTNIVSTPKKEEIRDYIKRVKKGDLTISEEFKKDYKNLKLWYFKSEGPKSIFDLPLMTLNRDYLFKDGEMDPVKFLNHHGFFEQKRKRFGKS